MISKKTKMTTQWKYAAGIVGMVTILALLSKTATTSVTGTNQTTRKQIKHLLRESEHEHLTATSQTTNLMLQIQAIIKAVTLAKTARKLAPESEVNQIAAMDVSEWIYDLETQEAALLTQFRQRYGSG